MPNEFSLDRKKQANECSAKSRTKPPFATRMTSKVGCDKNPTTYFVHKGQVSAAHEGWGLACLGGVAHGGMAHLLGVQHINMRYILRERSMCVCGDFF